MIALSSLSSRAKLLKQDLGGRVVHKGMPSGQLRQLARLLEVRGAPAYVIGGLMTPGVLDPAELRDVVGLARRR